MYEPIRTKSVHTTAGTTSDFPHRSREEELDIQLAGHLAALLAVTDEIRAIAPSGDLDAAGERLTAQVARLRDGVAPVRSSVADALHEPRLLSSTSARTPSRAAPSSSRRPAPTPPPRYSPPSAWTPTRPPPPRHLSRPTEPPRLPHTAPVRAHRSDVRTGCHSTAFAVAGVSLGPGLEDPGVFGWVTVTRHRRQAPSWLSTVAAERRGCPSPALVSGPRSGTPRSGCVPGPRRHPVFTPRRGECWSPGARSRV